MRIEQAPINSGFGAATTAAEVIAGRDLAGKVAIVTGGYSGIGLETTRALLLAGARVIVPARDAAKAHKALAGMQGAVIEDLDLMDPASVDAFASRFLASEQSLHILINNAGIMAIPLTRDAQGNESQFATNHLGHFRLTARLWPALCAAAGARIISLSSIGHWRAGVDFDDPMFERRAYDRWDAYGQSKTANALFAVALDARGAQHGVRAFAVHPGGVVTDLVRYMTPEELGASAAVDSAGRPVIDPERNMKTPQQGAATGLWCATSPQLDGLGGLYCENCDVALLVADDYTAAPGVSFARMRGVRSWAIDPEKADRLWRLSEQSTGVRLS